MKKPIVVSGLKPSGKLQLGNYLGAIKQYINFQNDDKYDNFYFIADYHALTQKYDAKEKNSEIIEMIADMLALGLDPKKATLYIQSDIMEITNISWLLGNVISAGQLQNMIEFREKVEQGQPASCGLLNYPILMAADILSFKASFVPVGEDQRQHVELARDAARSFNKRFGETFPIPKGIYVEGLRIKSLDDPSKKMSKSLPKGCLYLSDSPEDLRKKLRSAVTDSGTEIIYDPENKPALSNLLLIYSEFSGSSIKDIEKEHKDSSYALFKDALADTLIDSLSEFRKTKVEIIKDKEGLRKIYSEGSDKAREIASLTLKEMKQKTGLF